MEMSVREARAQFAAAIAAAERGERVTITRHGKAVAEIGPPGEEPRRRWSWDAFEQMNKQFRADHPVLTDTPVDIDWEADHAWSRKVLGLGDDWEPYRF